MVTDVYRPLSSSICAVPPLSLKQIRLLSLLLLILILSSSGTLAQSTKHLTQADREVWFDILKWPAEYENYYQTSGLADDPDNAYLTFYPLDDYFLVEVTTSLGAYQPSFIYMLYNPETRTSELIELPDYILDEDDKLQFQSRVELAGLASFKEESNELRIFSKWRGVGGCGSLNTYRFQALKPVLLNIRAQTCEAADAAGENMILDPASWPLIYFIDK